MEIVWSVVLIAALLAGNGVFVASEFALISSRKDRITALIDQGSKAAKRLLTATENLSVMLAGSQFGITLCSLVLGKVAEPAIAHYIEQPFTWLGVPEQLLHPAAFLIALAIITYLHIIIGEMIPKNFSIANPETIGMWVAPFILGWVRLTRPFILFLNFLSRMVVKALGIEQKDELDSTVDQEQLADMIAESREEGFLDADEHARLTKALRSEGRPLSDVLIPVEKVRTLPFRPGGPTIGELEEAVRETGFSRFPVTDPGGAYLGYVHVKDVLDRLGRTGEPIPRGLLRPLITLDGDSPLDDALHAMHRRSAHMAQVRTAGRLRGIVTLEDLIEEYVGTVSDWTHEEAEG